MGRGAENPLKPHLRQAWGSEYAVVSRVRAPCDFRVPRFSGLMGLIRVDSALCGAAGSAVRAAAAPGRCSKIFGVLHGGFSEFLVSSSTNQSSTNQGFFSLLSCIWDSMGGCAHQGRRGGSCQRQQHARAGGGQPVDGEGAAGHGSRSAGGVVGGGRVEASRRGGFLRGEGGGGKGYG